jgi:hypothetical protein
VLLLMECEGISSLCLCARALNAVRCAGVNIGCKQGRATVSTAIDNGLRNASEHNWC